MGSNSSSRIPHIHLLCMEEKFTTAFKAAKEQYGLPESVNVTYHESSLSQLEASVKFELVVSPANSYGRLDGGFDDAISRAFSPKEDYLALTRIAQAKLYETYRGFMPPGTCVIIPFQFEQPSRNVWGCKYVALCPTMRLPSIITWEREIVYECIWSLLCAMDNHNNEARVAKNEDKMITNILMTPIGTGVGFISPERWAAQTVLAIRHYIDACNNPEKWSNLHFLDVMPDCAEVSKTHEI